MKRLRARKSSAVEMAERRPLNPTWDPDYMKSRDERVLVTGCRGFIRTKVPRDNITSMPGYMPCAYLQSAGKRQWQPS
jgi:hypothetical protein